MASIIPLLTCISLASRALTILQATDPNDLSTYNNSIFLPYIHPFSANSTPKVHGSIHSKSFNFSIDTGSTGVIIGAPLLPFINATVGIPGWEFLSSSKLLYIGRFVTLPIQFYGKESTALANVPILIVDQSLRCPWYNSTTDRGACPPKGGTPIENPTKGIVYMGVGFGRNSPGSGLPFAIPAHNPFLNIDSINGKKLKESNYRNGYTVSTKGIWLGLTKSNTKHSAWVSLHKGMTDDSRDWAMVNMTFKVNGEDNYPGSALIDTGIPQMYIEATSGKYLPNITVQNPNNPPPKFVERVKSGTKLTFAFPGFEEGGIHGYEFSVGDASFASQPSYVVPETLPRSGGAAFVNTGRKFLYGFSVVFDAVGGRFGFQCLKHYGD
jgi:hypothetical protein